MADVIYRKGSYDIVGCLYEVFNCLGNGLFYFSNNPNIERSKTKFVYSWSTLPENKNKIKY